MGTGLQLIEKEICEKIYDELDKVGLLYRLFSRTKDDKSITEKVNRKQHEGSPYTTEGKKIQDLIGIRIVTYFQDDISLVKEILSKKFKFISEEIDELELTVFKPKRTNIICSLNDKQLKTLGEVRQVSSNENFSLIDGTFELQLRTILSEGWHEIDHSLRYKCKLDWEDHKEKERQLNGIYATLETTDTALKGLFKDLSYQHFKNKNWEALVRTKFRLKFRAGNIKEELIDVFNAKPEIAKQLIKLDRSEILKKIALSDLPFPMNMNNLLYIINLFEIQDENILALTPDAIKDYTYDPNTIKFV